MTCVVLLPSTMKHGDGHQPLANSLLQNTELDIALYSWFQQNIFGSHVENVPGKARGL